MAVINPWISTVGSMHQCYPGMLRGGMNIPGGLEGGGGSQG